VGLAQECAHARLLDTLVKLLTGLVARSLPLAHLAACLADEFDLRTLRGHAYLEIMHKGTFVAAHGATPPGDLDADGRLVLTVPQHYRLLAGYHALTGAWEALRTKPPAFEHAPNCGATWHQHGCTQSWLEFWKEKTRADNVLALGVADVIGRLRIIQKECESRAGVFSWRWRALSPLYIFYLLTIFVGHDHPLDHGLPAYALRSMACTHPTLVLDTFPRLEFMHHVFEESDGLE
jgi:hypothetical protein